MANFITIEGSDGSGKSTLLKQVADYFRKNKIPLLVTREPGGTKLGEKIRKIILENEMIPLTELFLYEAARAEHVELVIRPALKKGIHVICDRFTHSSLAYQAVGRGLDLNLVSKLNAIATDNLKPDAVIWLHLPPLVAHKRLYGRKGAKNRFDFEKQAFRNRVHRCFLNLSRKERNFITLNALKSSHEVFDELLAHSLWKKLFMSGRVMR